MALVIEDGSIVANANSYVTLVEARAYATARGVTLSVDDTVLEAQLIKAKDYIEFQASNLKGTKVDESQPLQYPRENLYIDGFEISVTTVPQQVKDLQSQLAVDLENGFDFFESSDENFITEETVGPLTTRYNGRYSLGMQQPYTKGFLNALLKGGSRLQVLRA